MNNPLKKIKILEEKIKALESIFCGDTDFYDKEVHETVNEYVKRILGEMLNNVVENHIWRHLSEFKKDEIAHISILDRLTKLEQHNYLNTQKIEKFIEENKK